MEENAIVNSLDKKKFTRIGLAMSALIVVTFVVQALMIVILDSIGTDIPMQNYIWVSMLSMYCVAVPVFYLIIRNIPTYNQIELGSLGEESNALDHMKMGPKKFLGFLAVCVAGMYIFNIVGIVINLIIGAIIGKEIVNPLEQMLSNMNMYLIFIFTVILAPLVEELIFRKIILDRVRIFGDKFAIIFTAVAFGLFHGNFSQFFYATALGIIFAYVTLRTGKLIYAILLHMLINFAGGFLGIKIFEMVGKAVEGATLSINELILMGIFPIVMLILFVSGIVVFFVNRKNVLLEGPKVEASSSEINRAAYINIGFILFLILSLIQFTVVVLGISLK